MQFYYKFTKQGCSYLNKWTSMFWFLWFIGVCRWQSQTSSSPHTHSCLRIVWLYLWIGRSFHACKHWGKGSRTTRQFIRCGRTGKFPHCPTVAQCQILLLSKAVLHDAEYGRLLRVLPFWKLVLKLTTTWYLKIWKCWCWIWKASPSFTFLGNCFLNLQPHDIWKCENVKNKCMKLYTLTKEHTLAITWIRSEVTSLEENTCITNIISKRKAFQEAYYTNCNYFKGIMS